MTLTINDIALSGFLNKSSRYYLAIDYMAENDGIKYTKKLNYYIHNEDSSVNYQFFKTQCEQYAYEITDDTEKYIIDTFEVLDSIIDLDFERVYSPDLAMVDIYKTNIHADRTWGIAGGNGAVVKSQTNNIVTWGKSYNEVIWEEQSSGRYLDNYPTLRAINGNTIVHEIAHVFGLRHDAFDPWDSRYTTENSRMSYNYVDGNRNKPSFTSLDIEALQAIWGVEKGNTPTAIRLSSKTFNENISENSSISILSTIDDDLNDNHIYSLVEGDGDTDNDSFIIDSNFLKIKFQPDFESKSSYKIRLKTTDQSEFTFTQAFTLSVNDLSEVISSVSNSNDSVFGGIGIDEINALEGNDSITGGRGNDVIDGGNGSDTSIYSGEFSNYSFTRSTSSIEVADQRTGTNDGTDTLTSIEYIQFSDQTVEESKVDIFKTYSGEFSDYKFYNKGNGVYEIKTDSGYDDITGLPLLTFTGEAATSSFRDISAIVDIKGTFDQVTGLNTDSGKMFRLYNASFKRLPDADGLKYWIEKYTSGENDERAVASSFLVSDEFKERYGANVSDSTYVNNLYQNVLGRLPDRSGLNYWLGQLNSGAETRYEVLLGFAESAENKALFTDMTGFG